MQKITMLLLLFALIPGTATANGQWTHFVTNNSDTDCINDIVREDNTVWCATRGGVVKWDAATGNNIIMSQFGYLNSVAVDWNGAKWFGGEQCVYVLGDTLIAAFNKNNTPQFDKPNGWVTDIEIDAVNKRILCVFRWQPNYGKDPVPNFSLLSYNGEKWEELVSFEQRFGGCRLAMDTLNPWNIWGSGDLGLYYRYFEKTEQGYMIHNSPPIEGGQVGVTSLAIEREGNVWMAATNVIYLLKRTSNTIFRYTSEVTGAIGQPNRVVIDRNGTKWFGANESIVKYDSVSWTIFPYTKKVEDDYLSAFAMDELGNAWLGRKGIFGGGYGLWRFSPIETNVEEDLKVPGEVLNIGISPNPFNPSTTISFSLPDAGNAELAVYSITGQKVRTLLSGNISAGAHGVIWDGRDDGGAPLSSGVYLSRLESGGRIATGKMLLVK